MSTLLLLIPLFVILAMLVFRKHMLVAGAAGGLVAVLIGGLAVKDANAVFMKGLPSMLGITVPIMYAAAATMVAKAGSIKAVVGLAQRGLGGRVGLLGAFMVLIQALATYMAGMGAGNTMVTAPLVAAAVGGAPAVIAGMAIATAASFTTSPASTETVLAAEFSGREVVAHATAMQPYTFLFWALGMALAVWGVMRQGAQARKDEGADETQHLPTGRLWIQALPAIALLLLVVLGGKLNGLIGMPLFAPFGILLVTVVLTFLCTPLSLDESAEALTEGARFILVTLFSVGLFLGFINMIGEIGTFKAIAEMAAQAPKSIVVPVAALAAFLVAIPAGAMTAGVLTLILPTLAAMGLPSEAMGLVAIATGLGTQISPVQVNVAALGQGFKKDIVEIVRGNLPYVLAAFGILLVISFIVF